MSSGIVGFIKSILGICETKPLSQDQWSLEGDKVRVKLSQKPDIIVKGGGAYLKGPGLKQPILVVRTDDDKYLAFSDLCPHGHRKIDPMPGQRMLRCCSFNHSTFDYEGKSLSGPAKESLPHYTVEMDKGDLLVKL